MSWWSCWRICSLWLSWEKLCFGAQFKEIVPEIRFSEFQFLDAVREVNSSQRSSLKMSKFHLFTNSKVLVIMEQQNKISVQRKYTLCHTHSMFHTNNSETGKRDASNSVQINCQRQKAKSVRSVTRRNQWNDVVLSLTRHDNYRGS